MRKEAPIALQDITGQEATVVLKFSEALHGCDDEMLRLASPRHWGVVLHRWPVPARAGLSRLSDLQPAEAVVR